MVVVTSDPSTTFSEPVTLTATLSPTAPATAAPTSGTVNFNLFGGSFGSCSAQPVEDGVATCTTSAIPAGDNLVAAVYSGTSNFVATSSALTPQEVVAGGTATVVTSSDTTTMWKSPLTFTATVTETAPATLAPSTGTVSFTADGDPITGCATAAVDAGVATCDGSALPIGAHTIAAIYSGSANYVTSTSGDITQTVDRATATAAVTTSDATTVWGESVTFTATVTPDAPATATPTGTVTFYLDGDIIIGSCLNLALTSGTATCATTSLPVGTGSISVAYNGSASYLDTDSAAITQTVAKSASATTLASDTNPSVTGRSVTFTATVTATAPGSGFPNGTVAFLADGTAISGCTARTLTNGVPRARPLTSRSGRQRSPRSTPRPPTS